MENEAINNLNNGVVVNNVGVSDVRNNDRVSIASSESSSAIVFRSKITNLLRRSSSRRESQNSVLESVPSVNNLKAACVPTYQKKTETKGWNTIVTIVLVEAKNLPDPPDDGSSHNLYCKFRLGSESFKSRGVANTRQPEWRERFDLHLNKDYLLRLSLWDKGKQKNFMGSAVLDLASLEKERTHEVWQQLDDGFGTVHFSVTLCKVRDASHSYNINFDEGVVKAKHAIHNLKSDWRLVGQLYVKVIGARGLSGKPNAYCVLELDNERVQTHSSRASAEPNWDKSYVFNVYDVTSTLDLKIYDNSIVTALRSDAVGRVSIPLLRITNGESRWYALKGRNNRNGAKGNCPRVQLEMTMFWNPVKATVRMFRPKEVKYLKKPPKFDVALVYSNMQFVRDTFNTLFEINEQYKHLFEWDNQEVSFAALVAWLVFWFYFRLWATPLLLLLPFFYYWITQPKPQERTFARTSNTAGEESPDQSDNDKAEKGLTGKIYGLQEMTLTITGGVEYTVSIAERLYNLASFKVPFLSFLTMIFLVIASAAFYYIPINYMMMALGFRDIAFPAGVTFCGIMYLSNYGIYKFTRKYMKPDRTLNNDLLDFLCRVPDNEILKDWKELSVPEPTQWRRNTSFKRRVSDSSS